MKIGDLVKFESGIKDWERDYQVREPGLVVDTIVRNEDKDNQRQSMTVLWADSSVTSEHIGYLKNLNKA